MGYHRRESVIEAFLKADYPGLNLDWDAMGYRNAKTCRASFSQCINRRDYPCSVEQRGDCVYLIKPGCHWEGPKKTKRFSSRMARTEKNVKDLLFKFIFSHLQVYELLWDRLGYVSLDSCYTSFRTSIGRYLISDQVFVAKNKEHLYLIKKPDPPTESTKLEDYWEIDLE